MPTDDRQAAQRRLADLITLLRSLPPSDQLSKLIDEADALGRAIAAFHLEGIRFRIYNVDRLVAGSGARFRRRPQPPCRTCERISKRPDSTRDLIRRRRSGVSALIPDQGPPRSAWTGH